MRRMSGAVPLVGCAALQATTIFKLFESGQNIGRVECLYGCPATVSADRNQAGMRGRPLRDFRRADIAGKHVGVSVSAKQGSVVLALCVEPGAGAHLHDAPQQSAIKHRRTQARPTFVVQADGVTRRNSQTFCIRRVNTDGRPAIHLVGLADGPMIELRVKFVRWLAGDQVKPAISGRSAQPLVWFVPRWIRQNRSAPKGGDRGRRDLDPAAWCIQGRRYRIIAECGKGIPVLGGKVRLVPAGIAKRAVFGQFYSGLSRPVPAFGVDPFKPFIL